MIDIDGAEGEGGGQVLRTALSLSLVTGQSFRLRRVRGARPKPGLLRQHLACVRAASEVGAARVEGDALGSTELTFHPRSVRAGDYAWDVGSAGSTLLVWQTVLWPLLRAAAPSTMVLRGGTHNPLAPTYHFVQDALNPLLERMGVQLQWQFDRHGFFPAGGGEFRCVVPPVSSWSPLALERRGAVREILWSARVAAVRPQVALRELDTLEAAALPWPQRRQVLQLPASEGPGNALCARIECEHVTESLWAFGERGVRAEQVAERLLVEVRRFLAADAPVHEHLADQLILPLALGAGGAFVAVGASGHLRTQIAMVQRFLPVRIELAELGADRCRVQVEPG